MPKASAPNAPCVLVWLSPHTIVIPGLREAELGADHVHDPLMLAPEREERNAEVGAVLLELRELRARLHVDDGDAAVGRRAELSASSDPSSRACDRCAEPRSPRSRSTENACGDVTSCTRCRSTYSTAGVALGLRLDEMIVPELREQRAG